MPFPAMILLLFQEYSQKLWIKLTTYCRDLPEMLRTCVDFFMTLVGDQVSASTLSGLSD